jgi:glutamate racemase
MNIGIFDSGLGGLYILNHVIQKLPEYNYIYLGDTKRLPYGNHSPKTVYQYTQECVDFLFRRDCQLIIIACNTAAAEALRNIQREYLPKHYPDRRVLGVVIPTVEELSKYPNIARVGVLATQNTVCSGAYIREINKIHPNIRVFQQPAPLLVPLIEYDGLKWVKPIIKEYLKPLLEQKIEAIILGCTHYGLIKDIFQQETYRIPIISQEAIIPKKLADYLIRHPEIDRKLDKKGSRRFYVTELTDYFYEVAKKWFNKNIHLKSIEI